MENQDSLPETNHNATEATPQTECLSSGSTLFWRLFVPLFGTVILSGFLLAFWLIPGEELYLSFPILWARIGMLVVWIGWIVFARRTLWRLKRVDASATHFFVTNYWTTVRYPWSDVERMQTGKRLGRRIVSLWLRAPGRFGQKISFLPGDRFEEWGREHEGTFRF